MNLDDLDHFKSLDTTGLLTQLDSLPDQLEPAWALGHNLPLPELEGVNRVVLCGLGHSATAGAMLIDLIADECLLPVLACPPQALPAWAAGEHTLLVALDTDEQSSAQARERGCRLAQAASLGGQGAAAHLLALLALFGRAGWVRDYAGEVASAAAAVRNQQKSLWAESPVIRNPAKRLAGQFMDRYVLVFGAGLLRSAARYWAERVQLCAKAWAQAEALPQAAYTAAVGTLNPEGLISKFMFIDLECESLSPADLALTQAARRHFMTSGFNTDFIRGAGPTRLAQLLTCLHYADYVAYYLAMAYGVDPAS